MSPKRIQRKRTKGWRMPDDAIYVGRPTRWGNPFRPVRCDQRLHSDPLMEINHPHWHVMDFTHRFDLRWETKAEAIEWAIKSFRLRVRNPDLYPGFDELRGHDLACWCPLDQPCHADVLLEIANPLERLV